jgi:3-oxoacyl-[acyl-carrier-protein] synthase-3
MGCSYANRGVQLGDTLWDFDGQEIFKKAVKGMALASEKVLAKCGVTPDQIDLVVPHQANLRIIESAAHQLEVPIERCLINVDRYGNTSTASIPIAICEAAQDGRIQPGDRLVMVAFGAGLTWASLAAQWSGPFPTKHKVYPAWYRAWARVASLARRLQRHVEGMIWGPKEEQ